MAKGFQKFHKDYVTKEGRVRIGLSKIGSTPWNKGKFGLYSKEYIKKLSLARLGKPLSNETKLKISLANKGKHSIHLTEKQRKKLSDSHKGKKLSEETKKKLSELHKGTNNYRWIKDRTKLQKYGESNKDRRSSAYRDWRTLVIKRDNYKCRMNNCKCSEKIIVHHIISYTKYPELRYNINNGITLCQFHHPLKRVEEQRLIPLFKQMVEAKKTI